jgi:hypothetical protein
MLLISDFHPNCTISKVVFIYIYRYNITLLDFLYSEGGRHSALQIWMLAFSVRLTRSTIRIC